MPRFVLSRPVAATMLALGMVSASPTALAQAFDVVRLYGGSPRLDGGLAGLGVIIDREYPGSDERRTRPLPLVDYLWRNGWFAGTSNGIGYNFSSRSTLDAGLRVTFDFGREESSSARLRGLGDIDPAAEIGAFVNVMPLPGFALTSSVRYGAGYDNKGLIADFGAVYSLQPVAGWRIGLGIAGSVVNDEYMQDYFGITAAQAARSGYAPYTPKGGLRDLRSNLSVTHTLTPRWSVTAAASVSRLLGDAADSPLSIKDTSVNGVVAVSYAF
jgi:outer membrane protein